MRELRWLLRQGLPFRRHAGASLVLASLLALFLTQPFHASPPPGAQVGASLAALASQLPAQTAAHDADLCSMCRATAQTRLGLRQALRLGEIAADRPSFALHLPAPARVPAAPELREAQPRAPPTSLLTLAS